MATESLTSAQIAERLGTNAEAAGLVRRHRSRVQSRRIPAGRAWTSFSRASPRSKRNLQMPMNMRVDSARTTTNESETEVIGNGNA